MQQLWQLKVNWDDPLNTELKEHWQRIQWNLLMIKCIQIDRFVISEGKVERVELHGFSDASEVAYGACTYVLSIDVQGKITTKLLCSKSRVAPTQEIISAKTRTLCISVVSRYVPSFISSFEDKFQQDQILD